MTFTPNGNHTLCNGLNSMFNKLCLQLLKTYRKNKKFNVGIAIRIRVLGLCHVDL